MARIATAALALLIASGCALRGPTAPIAPQDPWSRAAAIPTGSVLRVRHQPPGLPEERVEGTLAAIDQQTISLTTKRGAIQLARQDVRRIEERLPGPDSVKNGAIIGAIAGGAYGVIVIKEYEDGALGSPLGVAVTTAATGALFGALADWFVARPRFRTIYAR